MTDKEAAALDKKISVLQEKIIKVKHEYEDMLERLNDLMEQRNEESASRVQGELKAAREAMDAVYAEFVELTNALIVIGTAPELEPLAA